MNKKFDVIIFGASGYTGKYAIREGIKILNGLKWAVAGRNKEKLENILIEIGSKMNIDLSNIPIIIADVEDEKSIWEMTAQAKVIANCCGPYHLYGEVVVKACIDTGTSHVDISGEPQFIEKMQLKYHDLAREKGVYIISACGLESIPAEMGLKLMEEKFNGTVNSVENYLTIYGDKDCDKSGPSVNIGTYYSAVNVIANFIEMIKIRSKLNAKPLPKVEPKLGNRLIHKMVINGKSRWCIPLTDPDQSTVQRSQKLFFERDNKRPVQINSYLTVNNFYEVIGCLIIGIFLLLLSHLSFTRNWLLNYPEYFTFGVFTNKGPKEEKVEKTNFVFNIFGKGWKQGTYKGINENKTVPLNKKMQVKVSGKNPAYGATSAALLLCARTILLEGDKMTAKGVIAPGAAFEKTNLIEELKKNGYTFDILDYTE